MIEIINKPLTKSALYRVQTGDTMESISIKFNTCAQRILLDNPYFTDLYAGCLLYISNINRRVYIVKPADTINSICKELGISREKLIQDNKIRTLFIGQMLEY